MDSPVSLYGNFRLLLKSGAVTPVTAKTLLERLHPRPITPGFFNPEEYQLLVRVCDLLTDQTDGNQLVDIASFIDERLTSGKSEGWRFDHMPASPDMYRQGLRGINETANSMFDRQFTSLTQVKQISVLKALQSGTAAGSSWQNMAALTFFEEVLAEATEIFYSHPLAQEEISYNGMADAFGWSMIILNESEEVKQNGV
ncbi:MAG TPA: gluconate 2-dehydrogenase subunit 3 family protein [Daejeonella sp.]|nr:gluconate 2-dehydrogenase subunit 3 family protein [Daejeonella sp.]